MRKTFEALKIAVKLGYQKNLPETLKTLNKRKLVHFLYLLKKRYRISFLCDYMCVLPN